MILLGKVSGQNIIFGNIYAPNEEDPDFFLQFNKIILDFGYFPLIPLVPDAILDIS